MKNGIEYKNMTGLLCAIICIFVQQIHLTIKNGDIALLTY